MDSPYFDALAGRDLRSAGLMTWTGPLFTKGEIHTLIGSIEEIYAQAVIINPDQAVKAVDGASFNESISLAKRTQTSGCCNCLPEPNYGGFAMFDLLQSQYQWLQDGNGGSNGYCSTGDSGVARVACNTENEGLGSHAGSAVYFVNNRQCEITAPCNAIGNYVWQISANCYVPASAAGDPERVWPAQICDSAGWCVYVDGLNDYWC